MRGVPVGGSGAGEGAVGGGAGHELNLKIFMSSKNINKFNTFCELEIQYQNKHINKYS